MTAKMARIADASLTTEITVPLDDKHLSGLYLATQLQQITLQSEYW